MTTSAQSRAIVEALRTGHSMKWARKGAGLTKKEFRAWVAGEGIDAVAMARDMYEQQRPPRLSEKQAAQFIAHLNEPPRPLSAEALSAVAEYKEFMSETI